MCFCFKISYFVLKMQAQTFSCPCLHQTQSSFFIHLGTIPEAFPVFDLENYQEEVIQKVVPGCILFPHNWIRQDVRFCKVLEMYLSWQQRSCGSEEIRNSPPLSLTGSCKTFHANVRFINAGLYNSGSMCGKQWTKMTTCNFCWILCKASFVVIKILSPVVVVSDMLPINYCSKPVRKLMCGWDMQIEWQKVQMLWGN